ncbi:tRNA (guanine(46)-N(7))-methyltransferase TrmB [Alteromonas sp. ASW11-130]|uniref:tRNA (guanine(46)-N(7))-methyltransferase TrmB n=1 Tax=Alteromonas sp. ASW11-130 TaxID=3015775 RepID=UPI0022428504|nr:methyltransferase domain-containing protein [Alteromonas sp. ASW11-130]MCW8091961.1 tRNA (guanine-N(7)-)-methyltransferase [Alteromonas sp. ASW11-130]
MSESCGNSRSISTNQTSVHDKLDDIVKKYQQNESKRPISEHTDLAFEQTCDWLEGWQGPIILDSCCGVGESTANLANKFPDHKVIGIDKSEARIGKHHAYQKGDSNYLLIRADVNDFWRLVRSSNWQVSQHYLLYPNPYPKASQVQKRWHASAAMPALMAITGNIQVRSNWLVYLMEFARAASHYGVRSDLTSIVQEDAFTPFERKYQQSGQTCWKLDCYSEEGE